jgi:hypothetical protein
LEATWYIQDFSPQDQKVLLEARLFHQTSSDLATAHHSPRSPRHHQILRAIFRFDVFAFSLNSCNTSGK